MSCPMLASRTASEVAGAQIKRHGDAKDLFQIFGGAECTTPRLPIFTPTTVSDSCTQDPLVVPIRARLFLNNLFAIHLIVEGLNFYIIETYNCYIATHNIPVSAL